MALLSLPVMRLYSANWPASAGLFTRSPVTTRNAGCIRLTLAIANSKLAVSCAKSWLLVYMPNCGSDNCTKKMGCWLRHRTGNRKKPLSMRRRVMCINESPKSALSYVLLGRVGARHGGFENRRPFVHLSAGGRIDIDGQPRRRACHASPIGRRQRARVRGGRAPPQPIEPSALISSKPCSWPGIRSPAPLSLASRSRGRRDLECDRCQQSLLAWLSKLPCSLAFHRCTQVHLKSLCPRNRCKCTVVHLHDPKRGGVSQFFRCEAPFLLHHEIECGITPSLPARKALTPPLLQASLQAPPLHHYSDLYERAMWRQPVWPVESSESPGNHGPSRRHS